MWLLSGKAAVHLACLIDPSELTKARIPDSVTAPTVLVHEEQVIELPLTATGSDPNDYKFSMAFQPILGDPSSPMKYATLGSNAPGGAWPTNWADPGSYVDVVGGRDIRISPNLSVLTQPALGSWGGIFAATTGTRPLDGAFTPYFSNYNLNVVIDDANGNLTFGPGMYYVSSEVISSGTGLSIGIASGGSGDIEPVYNNDTSGVSYFDGYFVNAGPDGCTVQYIFAGSGTTTAAAVQVAPTMTPFFNSLALDNGMVEKIRPVAMSVLATYIGPELTNGGTIAGAYVKPDTLRTSYVTLNPNNQVGQLQEFNNLAVVEGAYNGPIKDGTYIWWKPAGSEDLLMRTPTEMNAHSYPGIIVSGQYVPNQAAASNTQAVVRFRVRRIYEYETNVTFLNACEELGSQAIMDEVNNATALLPNAMMNKAHPSFIQTALQAFKKGIAFMWNNRATIAKAAATLAPLVL